MIILGGDLASSCGLCYGRPDAVPTVKVIRAPVTREDLGKWGAFFWRHFNALLDELATQLTPGEDILVNYESPVLIEKKWDPEQQRMVGGNPIETTRKLQGLGMLLETACELHPAPTRVYECHLSSIKKEVTGNGRAEKADLVQAARRAGIVLPSGKEAYDGADAWGAWRLAIRYHAPEHCAQWDQRMFAAGGQERMSAEEARSLFPRR